MRCPTSPLTTELISCISLHWLRVPTYRTLHGDAPQYLRQFTPVASIPTRQRLRSQGRSQKFVFGGYKSFWGWIKLLNSRSDVILPHKSLLGLILGGINTDIHPRRYAPVRSSTSDDLCIPAVRLPTVGRRAFSVAGARVWNDLPANVTSALSLFTFRKRLKLHLFPVSYPGLVL